VPSLIDGNSVIIYLISCEAIKARIHLTAEETKDFIEKKQLQDLTVCNIKNIKKPSVFSSWRMILCAMQSLMMHTGIVCYICSK